MTSHEASDALIKVHRLRGVAAAIEERSFFIALEDIMGEEARTGALDDVDQILKELIPLFDAAAIMATTKIRRRADEIEASIR